MCKRGLSVSVSHVTATVPSPQVKVSIEVPPTSGMKPFVTIRSAPVHMLLMSEAWTLTLIIEVFLCLCAHAFPPSFGLGKCNPCSIVQGRVSLWHPVTGAGTRACNRVHHPRASKYI